MNGLTKTLIEQSGLRKDFLAKKVGIHPSQLSMAIKGDRTLPAGKEEEIKAYIAKLPK